MTNAQVAEAFVLGRAARTTHLWTDGDIIRSYATTIAQRRGDKVFMLKRKFSQTTAKQKGLIAREAVSHGLTVVPVDQFEDEPCKDCGHRECVCKSEFEHEEGDYVTQDYKTWFQYGKIVVTVDDPHDKVQYRNSDLRRDYNATNWQRAVMDHMSKSEFWPNVWYQGERGDLNLLDLTTGEFAK